MDTSGSSEPRTAKDTPPAGKQPPEVEREFRFEDAYARLEEVVAEMESGELPLEELLARFEEGVKLVRDCRAFLDKARLKVEEYVERRDGQWVLRDLDAE